MCNIYVERKRRKGQPKTGDYEKGTVGFTTELLNDDWASSRQDLTCVATLSLSLSTSTCTSSNDILFSSRMVRWQRKMKRIDSCLWKNIKSSYYHFLQLYVYIVHACKKHTTVLMSSQEINVIFSADICYWEKYGNTVSISSDLL